MINLSGIKNIIFDFGGVVIDIDFQAAANSFKKLGISDFSRMYSQISQVQLFDRFEKGMLSPQEFRTELKIFLPSEISDNQIDAAWNSMILNIPAKRVDLLLNLKNQYRTFLLSNTNKIHYDF
ncbi:MAG TPA: HAD family phosphatase, partial [Bacteroidales bacterium]|nr:HAD family phosphatase [Bacteroidales bacterium]